MYKSHSVTQERSKLDAALFMLLIGQAPFVYIFEINDVSDIMFSLANYALSFNSYHFM